MADLSSTCRLAHIKTFFNSQGKDLFLATVKALRGQKLFIASVALIAGISLKP